MRFSVAWLLFLGLAEDFLGNYRGSLRRVMSVGEGNFESRYDYVKNKFLKEQQIEKEGKFLRLTSQGRGELLKRFPLLEWRKKEWDGVWRVMMYDFPESMKTKRDLLRRFLKRLGFAQWQISVWVSPHPVIGVLNGFLEEYELQRYCSVHESRRVVGVSDKRFARRIWKLDEIQDEYKSMVRSFDDKEKFDYLEKLMDDPLLPKELLPKRYLWEKLMRMVVDGN